MSLASNTLLRAAAGVILLPVVLVGGIALVTEPAGGIPFGPEMALIMIAEAFFICLLVQAILLRTRKTGLAWYAAAYAVPFGFAGYWFSDGADGGAMPLIAVLALTGGIGVVLGLAQWVIVVWRNVALQAEIGNAGA